MPWSGDLQWLSLPFPLVLVFPAAFTLLAPALRGLPSFPFLLASIALLATGLPFSFVLRPSVCPAAFSAVPILPPLTFPPTALVPAARFAGLRLLG